MKAPLTALALLAIVVTPMVAQSAVNTDSSNMNRAQLKALTRHPKSKNDYLTLRDYYAHQAELKRHEAAEAKIEWERRSAATATLQKYPSSIDSAHYLYVSHLEDAESDTATAKRYEALASHLQDQN